MERAEVLVAEHLDRRDDDGQILGLRARHDGVDRYLPYCHDAVAGGHVALYHLVGVAARPGEHFSDGLGRRRRDGYAVRVAVLEEILLELLESLLIVRALEGEIAAVEFLAHGVRLLLRQRSGQRLLDVLDGVLGELFEEFGLVLAGPSLARDLVHPQAGKAEDSGVALCLAVEVVAHAEVQAGDAALFEGDGGLGIEGGGVAHAIDERIVALELAERYHRVENEALNDIDCRGRVALLQYFLQLHQVLAAVGLFRDDGDADAVERLGARRGQGLRLLDHAGVARIYDVKNECHKNSPLHETFSFIIPRRHSVCNSAYKKRAGRTARPLLSISIMPDRRFSPRPPPPCRAADCGTTR